MRAVDMHYPAAVIASLMPLPERADLGAPRLLQRREAGWLGAHRGWQHSGGEGDRLHAWFLLGLLPTHMRSPSRKLAVGLKSQLRVS